MSHFSAFKLVTRFWAGRLTKSQWGAIFCGDTIMTEITHILINLWFHSCFQMVGSKPEITMSSFFWRGADKIDKVCLADAQNLGLELQLHAEARASGRGHMPSRVRACSRAEREAEGAGGRDRELQRESVRAREQSRVFCHP